MSTEIYQLFGEPTTDADKPTEPNSTIAARRMLTVARALFSRRAQLPPTDPTDPAESFMTLSQIGPLADAYKFCYWGFCDYVGIRHPTEDFGAAVMLYAEELEQLRRQGVNTDVYRCVDHDKNIWALAEPMDVHTRIMRLYQRWKDARAERFGKGRHA